MVKKSQKLVKHAQILLEMGCCFQIQSIFLVGHDQKRSNIKTPPRHLLGPRGIPGDRSYIGLAPGPFSWTDQLICLS